MPRVLIVAHYFPPDGGAGAQRPAKFCKYLRECGWEPFVLTRTPAKSRGMWDPEDASLLREVEACATIERVDHAALMAATPTWSAGLPAIEGDHRWVEGVAEAAGRMVREHRIDCVLVTMSPFSAAYVGRRLKSETGVKVVYDLRDPWALDGWRIYGSSDAMRIDREEMERTLLEGDGVIANTPEARRTFLHHFKQLDSRKVTVIPNGFDAADFDGAPPPRPQEFVEGRFHIVHTGTFHDDEVFRGRGLRGFARSLLRPRPERIDPTGRTLMYLLRAIAWLREQGNPAVKGVRVVHVGQATEATKRLVEESGAGDCVSLLGYRPHDESVAWVRNADALFLPLHGLPGGERSRIVPGKTYEYIAARRPILGCLPPGDARDLVMLSGLGFLAHPLYTREIAESLARLMKAVELGTLRDVPEPQWLVHFERRSLTQRLAEFLSVVTGAGDGGRPPETNAMSATDDSRVETGADVA